MWHFLDHAVFVSIVKQLAVQSDQNCIEFGIKPWSVSQITPNCRWNILKSSWRRLALSCAASSINGILCGWVPNPVSVVCFCLKPYGDRLELEREYCPNCFILLLQWAKLTKTVHTALLGFEFVFLFLGCMIHLYVRVCFVLPWRLSHIPSYFVAGLTNLNERLSSFRSLHITAD